MNKKKSLQKKILIIDDDVSSVNVLKTFLESKGYVVFHAEDGEKGLANIKEISPNIVLLDILMPKIDGFTVAKQIRFDAQTKDIPIIVFSAQEGMKELFAIEGITDYLVKPVNTEELLEMVQKKIK
ncbi:MAG: response regulator [Candidatus Omnitrophica bacterium]|nr:response regulator [Candidatus Omnitrophota bacterium]